jgi:hypothetical protein
LIKTDRQIVVRRDRLVKRTQNVWETAIALAPCCAQVPRLRRLAMFLIKSGCLEAFAATLAGFINREIFKPHRAIEWVISNRF